MSPPKHNNTSLSTLESQLPRGERCCNMCFCWGGGCLYIQVEGDTPKTNEAKRQSARSRSRQSQKGAEMSGGDVVCSGWLRKSPPEKKLRRYVSALLYATCYVVIK